MRKFSKLSKTVIYCKTLDSYLKKKCIVATGHITYNHKEI